MGVEGVAREAGLEAANVLGPRLVEAASNVGQRMAEAAASSSQALDAAANRIGTKLAEAATTSSQALEAATKLLAEQLKQSMQLWSAAWTESAKQANAAARAASENLREAIVQSTLLLYFSLILVLWWQSIRSGMAVRMLLLWLIPAVLAGAVFVMTLSTPDAGNGKPEL